jgi:crotonobetainyl-CoA:carnitine CoA-transferase CaiB-like acyl-CoA transferase
MLQEALDLINVKMLRSLDYGEERRLTPRYTLYHYSSDDVIVVNIDTDEDWEELVQVLWNHDTDEDSSIIYEVVERDLYNQEMKK